MVKPHPEIVISPLAGDIIGEKITAQEYIAVLENIAAHENITVLDSVGDNYNIIINY